MRMIVSNPPLFLSFWLSQILFWSGVLDPQTLFILFLIDRDTKLLSPSAEGAPAVCTSAARHIKAGDFNTHTERQSQCPFALTGTFILEWVIMFQQAKHCMTGDTPWPASKCPLSSNTTLYSQHGWICPCRFLGAPVSLADPFLSQKLHEINSAVKGEVANRNNNNDNSI